MERMIAVHQCSYVTVLQARANMPAWIGSLAWFAPDDAKTSVFTPLYAGNFKVPTAFEIGRRDRFDRNSAFWASNFVSNWSNLNWRGDDPGHPREAGRDRGQAVRRPAGHREDSRSSCTRPIPTARATFISDYSNRVAQENFMKWWELADKLVTDYQDGGARDRRRRSGRCPADWLEQAGAVRDAGAAGPGEEGRGGAGEEVAGQSASQALRR